MESRRAESRRNRPYIEYVELILQINYIIINVLLLKITFRRHVVQH